MPPVDEEEDKTIYKVVLNHEEQYSIWPADRENPSGWKDDGTKGLKQVCLDHIKEVWTDMRPLSLRKKMEEDARRRAESPPPAEEESTDPGRAPAKDDLVHRLSEGDHPVEAGLRPERTVQALKECIDRDYVHIKFTGTRGGTELGVRLDRGATDLTRAAFADAKGNAHLVGNLTLNYVKVRCVADIDLQTLSGTGHLEILE